MTLLVTISPVETAAVWQMRSARRAVSRRGARRDDVEAARRAADRVRAGRFGIAFDRLCSFQGRGRHPLVLRGADTPAVAHLREALRGELVRAGLWHGQAGFEPHVTLMWSAWRVPETGLERSIGWTVRDFVLVRSLVGQARQIELGRWPLNAG